jgi:UDP-glucose 4-epimerase
MASILISGIAGFLGSNLAERLLKDKHEVIGVDNLIGGDIANVPNGATFYNVDCTDLIKTKAVFLKHPIEIVYHCAASPHEGLSVFSPCIVNKNTYMSTVVLATAAASVKTVKRFVFCSSMSRYGKSIVNPPWTENSACFPEDPYGIAKLSSEMFLTMFCREHGIELVIVVPHNAYGPKQRYYDPFRNVASIMVNLMLQGRQPIIYGDGEQKRCFSYIDDCVEPLVKMGFQPDIDGLIFNIGPDHLPITINNLCGLLRELLDFPDQPIYYPERPCEVKNAWPSSDRARKILGYEDKVPLADGMQNLIDWIVLKGPRPFEYSLPIEIESERTPETWVKKIF